MFNFKLIFLVAYLVTLLYVENVCFGMRIVDEGVPNAYIVIDNNAPSVVQHASKELQNYIKKMAGVDLPIINDSDSLSTEVGTNFNYIFVGQSKYTRQLNLTTEGLGVDGYKIIAQDNWLALFGKDYAGQKILEGTRHPFQSITSYNKKLNINRFGETGTLYATYNFLEKYCGVRWYMPGEIGEVIPKTLTIEVGPINYNQSPDFELRSLYSFVFDSDDDMTLWYRRAGFGDPYSSNFNHSFDFFKKYEKSHPEYFAVADGERDKTIVDLCLSRDDVVNQWVKNACEYFNANPAQKIYPIVPHDRFLSVCGCAKCQSQVTNERGQDGRFSDYVWGFVNKVAKEVQKTYPDKFIGCLAYETFALPPNNIDKLSPNVAVMITKFRLNYWNDDYRKKTNSLIDDWDKKTSNIYVWEYYNHYLAEGYLHGFPVVCPHIIALDLKNLKNTTRGEFIEAETTSPVSKMAYKGFMHLNLYVTAKLFWDADTDVDKLLEEYYGKFYGPARLEMKQFFTTAERFWMETTVDRSSIATQYNSEKLISFLKKAKAKTNNDIYTKRIDILLDEIQNKDLQQDWCFDGSRGAVPISKPLDLDDNLVAYWKFDEGKGNKVADLTNYNNDGRVYDTKWIQGNKGSSLQFDGRSSYVEVCSSQSLSSKDQVTVEGWFYWGSRPTTRFGLIFNTSYNYILINECGAILFRIWNEDGITAAAGFWEKDILHSEWNHIVGTYDGNMISIYLNGKIQQQVLMSGKLKSGASGKMYLGKRDTSGDIYYDGLIDEVRIYSKSLNALEIKAHYEDGIKSILAD